MRQTRAAGARREIVAICRDLYLREMVGASGGNVSVRLGDAVLITAGGKSLGRLTARHVIRADLEGGWSGANRPSKELPMHLAVYAARPDVRAVVHTHSPCAVAVSCMHAARTRNALPVLTPGYAARVGTLPLIPYARPGSKALQRAVSENIRAHNAILLRNHGVVAVGTTLEEAVNRAEEVEENAKIFLLAGGKARPISAADVREIERVFGGGGVKR